MKIVVKGKHQVTVGKGLKMAHAKKNTHITAGPINKRMAAVEASLADPVTELHYNAGGTTVDIDGAGIVITNSGHTVTIAPTTGSISLNTSAYNLTLTSQTILLTTASTGKTLTLNAALLTHDMSIQEADVCVAGVAMKVLGLFSAPF